VRVQGAITNTVALSSPNQSVTFIYRDSAWQLSGNSSFVNPIAFVGTNVAANAAASRTNLGLGGTSEPEFQSITLIEGTNSFTISAVAGVNRTNLGLPLAALTNTNNANFQGAIFSATNVAPTNTTNRAAWINLQVGTNTYKLPLYQ
jgi:hypothetical protein